jgi:hypothetical protein
MMDSGIDLLVWPMQNVLLSVIRNMNKSLKKSKVTVLFAYTQKINLMLCLQIPMFLVLKKNKIVYLGILDSLAIFAQKGMKNLTIPKFVKKLFLHVK